MYLCICICICINRTTRPTRTTTPPRPTASGMPSPKKAVGVEQVYVMACVQRCLVHLPQRRRSELNKYIFWHVLVQECVFMRMLKHTVTHSSSSIGCVHCFCVFGSGLTRVFGSVWQLCSCVFVFGRTRVRVFGMFVGYISTLLPYSIQLSRRQV